MLNQRVATMIRIFHNAGTCGWSRHHRLGIVLGVLLGVVFFNCGSAQSATSNSGFSQWLNQFSAVARQEGISNQTWQKAFTGITSPDAEVLEKAQYQPEFTTEIWDYLDARVNENAVRQGGKMAIQHGATLAAIEQQFGIDRNIILAIWSMESAYGAILERTDRLHYVPLALATLGYGDPKRAKFARSQLVAALKILQSGDIDRTHLMGSWAGAMGHTQFIPTSYLLYGVDFDGDGRRDIWQSVPDALATAANLLHKNGWQSGKTWGYEIVLPQGGVKFEGATKPLAEWAALGFKRPGGLPFPRPEDKAECKLLAGPKGPAYLMMKNFFVIKRYNNSNSYALAVGLLADRFTGHVGPQKAWPRPLDALSGDEKFELQRLLLAQGFYSGEIDGNLGEKSRTAILSFQHQAGLEPDGLPTKTVLQALRKRQ